MDDEKKPLTRPRVMVGTIGHIDHGKTTLMAAIATVLSKQFSHLTPTPLDDPRFSRVLTPKLKPSKTGKRRR